MTTFQELGLPQTIVRELRREGITEPFPMQVATIPDILAGRDVLGRGPTGSGKTFAFGLPMLSRLAGAPSRPQHPRALVLVPTRELAMQVKERLDAPAAALGLRILTVVGGVNIKRDVTFLAAPVDLLIATPGRAIDLVKQGLLHLDEVEITAIDECDQMADLGFLPQVSTLLQRTPQGQRLLFSATLDGDVQALVDRFIADPVLHATAAVTAAVDTMEHYQFDVGTVAERDQVVLHIAGRAGKTLLFRRTRYDVDRQVKALREAGIDALGLHGNKGQASRTEAVRKFTSGECRVLVATDIAARGIDISDVSLVVHVDPPANHKAYLHRAGRTARAGAAGMVVTLATDKQLAEVTTLFKQAGVRPHRERMHAHSSRLRELTGARKPKGKPVELPHQRPHHRKPRRPRRPGR